MGFLTNYNPTKFFFTNKREKYFLLKRTTKLRFNGTRIKVMKTHQDLWEKI